MCVVRDIFFSCLFGFVYFLTHSALKRFSSVCACFADADFAKLFFWLQDSISIFMSAYVCEYPICWISCVIKSLQFKKFFPRFFGHPEITNNI